MLLLAGEGENRLALGDALLVIVAWRSTRCKLNVASTCDDRMVVGAIVAGGNGGKEWAH